MTSPNTGRVWLAWAAFFGMTAVALGAFGAHGLEAHFAAQPDAENVFRTGTLYHLVHAVALIGVVWAGQHTAVRWAKWAGTLFALGIVFFSGSLYGLSIFNLRFLGAVAPVGGAALIGGWVCLFLAAVRRS